MTKQINSILSFLNKNNNSPKNIEFTKIKNMHFVSTYNHVSSQYISESIASGASYNEQLALLKSLVEFVERFLSKNHSKQFKLEGMIRSDGFAAYPISSSLAESKLVCRDNAYHEAFERYSWAKWWDDENYGFRLHDNDKLLLNENKEYAEHILDFFDIEDIKILSPFTSLDCNSHLIVLIAKIDSCGYITGGAAGKIGNTDDILGRALGELTRHLLCFRKMHKSFISNLSFYEQRLYNFASGLNNELVSKRLSNSGSQIIEIPQLVFDSHFQHEYYSDFILHRCLFKNQPIFIGGNVDRLCL